MNIGTFELLRRDFKIVDNAFLKQYINFERLVRTTDDGMTIKVVVMMYVDHSDVVVVKEYKTQDKVVIHFEGVGTIEGVDDLYRLLTGKSLTYDAPNQRGD